jgi:hypothetical protein
MAAAASVVAKHRVNGRNHRDGRTDKSCDDPKTGNLHTFERWTGLDLDGDGYIGDKSNYNKSAMSTTETARNDEQTWLERLECVAGIDLDGDGFVGAPPPEAKKAGKKTVNKSRMGSEHGVDDDWDIANRTGSLGGSEEGKAVDGGPSSATGSIASSGQENVTLVPKDERIREVLVVCPLTTAKLLQKYPLIFV